MSLADLEVKGPPCTECGMWVCNACGWKRNRANRYFEQSCHHCQCTLGKFLPIYHYDSATREDHAQQAESRTRQAPAPSVEF